MHAFWGITLDIVTLENGGAPDGYLCCKFALGVVCHSNM